MGLERYRDCVLMHKGHSLYESEVHPSVVSAVMGRKVMGRSYVMSPDTYKEWIEKTGMDMMYVYVPWPVARQSKIDKWGVINWENGYFNTTDLRRDPPYDTIKRRLDALCKIKDGFGIEVALYDAPMLLMDGMGLEKFSMEMYDNPDKLESWLNVLNSKVCLELEIILEYPVDAVQISHLLADKNGQVCSDEHLERFHFKYLRDHIQHIRARGKIATLHCDGKLDKLYPRFFGTGIQCINGYDSNKFVVDLKRWGQSIAMRGCISMDGLYRMSVGEMRLAVQKAKSWPAHVISSTHNFPDVNPALFVAMIEEFKA